MKEKKIRYISLIIVGIEVLALYLFFYLTVLDDEIKYLGNPLAHASPWFLTRILILFTLIGILILLSAFFKHTYHFLALFELGLITFYFVKANQFDPLMIPYWLVPAAPFILYYVCLIIIKTRKDPVPDDKANIIEEKSNN